MKYLLILPIFLTLAAGQSLAETSTHGYSAVHRHKTFQIGAPCEPGQGAFASIQEIVELLLSDPETDWDRVNLEALRGHLADMDNVTLRSTVAVEPLTDGARFTVTSEQGSVRQSIKNTVLAHSHEMSATFGWNLSAEEVSDGAVWTATGSI